MRPSNSDIDTLEAFPFLSGCLDGLKSEFPAYIAASEDVDPDYDHMDFWRSCKEASPSFAAALSKVLLVQLSSAASEREESFSDQQYRSLQDYIEASLMFNITVVEFHLCLLYFLYVLYCKL